MFRRQLASYRLPIVSRKIITLVSKKKTPPKERMEVQGRGCCWVKNWKLPTRMRTLRLLEFFSSQKMNSSWLMLVAALFYNYGQMMRTNFNTS